MLKENSFCLFCFALVVALSSLNPSSLVAQDREPSRPNVILMMADDMGWGSIDAPGFSVRIGLNPDGSEVRYPGTPHWETPNLAAMANNGLLFSRMYSQSPVCSPTRASVMTGRHPERVGIPFANTGNMENREITVAEYAQSLGYTTGIFGKWHLGSMTREVDDSNRGGPGSFGVYSFPTNNGFDEVYATESRTNTFNPLQLNPTTHYWTNPGVFVPFNAPEILGDDSQIVARETNAFMEQAVADGEPFLTIVWFHTPHKPVTSPTAARNSLGAYITSMEDLDTAIGQIRAKVQQLGIADNTILAFTSDNGPEDDQDWNDRNLPNGVAPVPLRANKRELYEGGVRVPGIIEWPGEVEPGETHTPMVTTDYLPTLLEIWGIDPVDDRPLDGQSMVNTIFNDHGAERERTIVFQSTNNHQSALGFNGRYKLLSTNGGSFWRLYDIVFDFDEDDPLATSLNIDSQPQAIQDIYNSLLADFNSRNASIGSGLDNSFSMDYLSRVVSESGIVVGDEPPENLGLDQRQNNTPELFIERQYATLRETLTLDSDGSEGSHDVSDTATLPAGTVVHSYLVHHDPTGGNMAQFEVTFEDKIVGVIGSPGLLDNSDSLSFADPNFQAGRGLDENQDSWTISSDGHTISFWSVAGVPTNDAATFDVVEVQESITVLADGDIVPVDGNGNIDTSGFADTLGPRDPTTGLSWQYGIRERNAFNQTQFDRRAYSFLRFDVSNLTFDPTDPNFSAMFRVDYQGHLNNTNGGFNVQLGQVTGAWNTSTAPSAALSTGSTPLGILVANVSAQPNQVAGIINVDITELVRGWADGSIPNNGLTFTGNQEPQGAYFSNATIMVSDEPMSDVSEGMDQVRILTESSLQFVPLEDSCLVGDVNRDGVVGFSDIGPFVDTLLSGEFQCEADINLDGFLNFSDIRPFVDLILGSS